jgi:endonuclease YncB( thermonuclease family)
MRPTALLLAMLSAIACRESASTDLGGAPPDLTPPLIPSGCPTPPVVRPADLDAARFLPAEDVLYLRTVDGDTMHFLFKAGERVVRVLWVNTEEKGGADATAFGMATVPIVEGWMTQAKLHTVAFEVDPRQAGQPHLDTFDRYLSVVFLDGELLQTRLVREGLSAYYTQFGCAPQPIHDSLLWAEAEARANKRGIWATGHPTNYEDVFDQWIRSACRPNPYQEPYCK